MKTTGMIVESYRKERNMSQKELAERLEITYTYLSLIENDDVELNKPLLGKIIEQLEIREIDATDMYYYEEFRKTPSLIKMRYFELLEENIKLKDELAKYQRLDRLDKLLSNIYNR